MRISSSYFTDYSAAQMNAKQAEIAKYQDQISSGKRVSKPSDDPAIMARSQTIDSSRLRLEQFQKNAVTANQRIALEEDTLDRVTDLIQRTQELALQAKSGTVTKEKLYAHRTEVQELQYALVDYANTRNANGEYIFAGKMGKTQPFVMVGDDVKYQGDQGSIELQIGSSRTVPVSDSGDEIFLDIPSGNGTFAVSADQANTGTAVVGTGTVVNNVAYQAEDFKIEFTSPTEFDVVNETTGAAVLTAQPYTSNDNITFNGVSLRIQGEPAAGDSFSVKPSTSEDLFSTLQRFIDATETPPSNPAERAKLDQELNTVIDNLDQAHIHINSERSAIGARLRYIESANEENSSVDHLLQTTLSDMLDTDYAEAASKLQYEMTALEAVRQTYSTIQSNSLFNYL